MFIDAHKQFLVYSHTEAKKLAEWLLTAIKEKEEQGITIDKI